MLKTKSSLAGGNQPFDDSTLEQEFRYWAHDDDVEFFSRAVLVVGVVFFTFIGADFLSLGLCPAFYVAAGIRLFLLATLSGFWLLLMKVQDPSAIDRITAGVAWVVVAAQVSIYAAIMLLEPTVNQGEHIVSAQLVIILSIYLFLPNRIAVQRIIGWAAALMFLGATQLGSDSALLNPYVIGLFIVVNVLGELLARRRLAHHRAQFLSIRAEAELNSRLRSEVERREHLEQDRNRIYSTIGHDLRSPVATMIGTTEILSEDAKELPLDEIVSLARATNRNAHVLLDLLDNLLHWGRMQAGGLRFEPASLDLSSVIAKVVALLEPTARDKHVNLTCEDFSASEVIGDPTMIATVIRNLVSNGIKFTPAGGGVSIGVKDCGDSVEISVCDTGIGIDPAQVPKLLQGGVKDLGIGTAGEAGTGLGLLVSGEFLRRHGSELKVKSDVGQGAIFSFRLPVVSDSRQMAAVG